MYHSVYVQYSLLREYVTNTMEMEHWYVILQFSYIADSDYMLKN